MGGGDWIEQRQMEQKQQLHKAYEKISPKIISKESSDNESVEVESESVMSATSVTSGYEAEIKMDGIDHAYVWARTFTPSWIMGLIFLAGLAALAPKILSKFGVDIKFQKRNK